VLADTRAHRNDLEGDLKALEKEQAAVLAKIQAAQNPGAQPAGPVRQGSGSMIWPINGTFTSPFGYRWGRLHAGIDLAAPEGTPIRAADSGRVILAAWTGGYGNYTCISHSSSLSTCYGHQSRFGTSAGASVSKGQVIGYVGNTGHSFGAHLHFEVRVNGNPVDPMGYL
jgi:murein DD-endopeptidase MepM/ murein hydrolase activator NlpD